MVGCETPTSSASSRWPRRRRRRREASREPSESPGGRFRPASSRPSCSRAARHESRLPRPCSSWRSVFSASPAAAASAAWERPFVSAVRAEGGPEAGIGRKFAQTGLLRVRKPVGSLITVSRILRGVCSLHRGPVGRDRAFDPPSTARLGAERRSPTGHDAGGYPAQSEGPLSARRVGAVSQRHRELSREKRRPDRARPMVLYDVSLSHQTGPTLVCMQAIQRLGQPAGGRNEPFELGNGLHSREMS